MRMISSDRAKMAWLTRADHFRQFTGGEPHDLANRAIPFRPRSGARH